MAKNNDKTNKKYNKQIKYKQTNLLWHRGQCDVDQPGAWGRPDCV